MYFCAFSFVLCVLSRPFAFVTRRDEYKHLCCAKIKPIMNLCTSVFVYVGSIGLYKRIVNADTQSIRIANADGQGCAIHKTYSRTFSKQHLLDKSRHLQQHLLFKFYKTVVRDSFGKQMFAMLTDVVQVVMFETTESTRVEMYEYDNNLSIAHTIRLTTVALAIGW